MSVTVEFSAVGAENMLSERPLGKKTADRTVRDARI